MEIKTLKVDGFAPAIYAMRAPMTSFDRSDSSWELVEQGDKITEIFNMGEKDKELSIKLQKAGPEHCKHLRMVQVWAEISAPLFWLKQLDTYRFGVEKVSTSTMHTITKRPLTKDDFECDCMNDDYINYMLDSINTSMEAWQCETDPEYKKQIWQSIIQALPESFIQTRIYMFSYAALRNIVRQREGHKLKDWQYFIEWCHTLPNSWMIFE